MYEGLVKSYDLLMRDVPYEEWADIVISAIDRYGVSRPGHTAGDALSEERDLVVDLGCGTGTFSCIMADRGFDVTGIDISPEMLAAAGEKNAGREYPVQYLCQDMRELDLYCTAGTFVSVCDSVNYLLKPADLVRSFSLVNRFLFPGGIFVFDFHTKYYYRSRLGSRVITDSGEEVSYIWENWWDERRSLNDYDITFFVRRGDGLYERCEESQVQRGYTLREVRSALSAAGLEFIEAFDERTRSLPGGRSERIFVIARERGKEHAGIS